MLTMRMFWDGGKLAGGSFGFTVGLQVNNILAHEIGHTLGLSDEYTYNPGGNSISAADKDNLMNYGGDKSKLRYNQWRTVNP